MYSQDISQHAIEAVVLTGGASRRMGRDKAGIELRGKALAVRILDSLREAGVRATVLGREPVAGYPFLADEEEYAGPLSAVRRFMPKEQYVFIVACDVALFDPAVLDFFVAQIGDADACLAVVDGEPQFLCGLYRSRCFDLMRQSDDRSFRRFVKRIECQYVNESDLTGLGLDSNTLRGANDREEFAKLTGETLEDD